MWVAVLTLPKKTQKFIDFSKIERLPMIGEVLRFSNGESYVVKSIITCEDPIIEGEKKTHLILVVE